MAACPGPRGNSNANATSVRHIPRTGGESCREPRGPVRSRAGGSRRRARAPERGPGPRVDGLARAPARHLGRRGSRHRVSREVVHEPHRARQLLEPLHGHLPSRHERPEQRALGLGEHDRDPGAGLDAGLVAAAPPVQRDRRAEPAGRSASVVGDRPRQPRQQRDQPAGVGEAHVRRGAGSASTATTR